MIRIYKCQDKVPKKLVIGQTKLDKYVGGHTNTMYRHKCTALCLLCCQYKYCLSNCYIVDSMKFHYSRGVDISTFVVPARM